MVSDALHLGQGQVECRRAVRGQFLHDIALRHDADDTLIRARHNQRTNFPLGQEFGRSGQICRGLDGENLGALHG
jgi:hypothetical protein